MAKEKQTIASGGQSKRARISTSRLIGPEQLNLKRRRFLEKRAEESNTEIVRQIVELVKQETPRVGKHQIQNTQTLQLIQQLFDDKTVKRVISCRGTDRTLQPPIDLIKGEAPLRRAIAVNRENQDIMVEEDWEEWEDLAQRQKVRAFLPCSVNITVFAANPNGSPAQSEASQSRHVQKEIDWMNERENCLIIKKD